MIPHPGLRRTIVDPLEDGVRCVEVLDTPRGCRLVSARRVARLDAPAGPRIDVIARDVDVRLERIDLPGVTRAEARQVAARRAAAATEDGDTQVSTLIDTRDGSSALWLIRWSAQGSTASDAKRLREGIVAQRSLPLCLALGALAHRYREPGDETLSAVLWVDPGAGVCVVSDRHGWRFDREISLKYAAESPAGGEPARPDAGTGRLSDDDEQFCERVSTELERTFTYVEHELGTPRVEQLIVCGRSERLRAVGRAAGERLGLRVIVIGDRVLGGRDGDLVPGAAAALGAAMLPRAAAIATTLPRELALPRRAALARRGLVVGIAVALLFALALVGTGTFQLRAEQAALAETLSLSGDLESSLATLRERGARHARAEAIHRAAVLLRRPEPAWAATLAALAWAMPEELVAERVALARQADRWSAELLVEAPGLAQAAAASVVDDFQRELEQTELLSVRSVTLRQGDEAHVDDTRFQLLGWLAPVNWDPIDAD